MAKKSRRLTSKPALEGELEMSDLDRVVGGVAVAVSQKQIDDHPNAVHEMIAVPAAHVAAPEPPHPTVVQQALAADHTALDAATTALSNAQHDQAGHTGALADANKTLVDARVVLGHENTALANDSKALAGFTQQQGTLDARVDGEHKSLALDQQKLAGGMHDLKSSQSQLTDAQSIAAADATAVSHTQSNLTKAQQVLAQDQRAVDADHAAIAHQHGPMTAAERYRLSADQQHWTAQERVVEGLQSVLSRQSHDLLAANQHVADVKHAIAQETSDIAAEQKAVATVEANLAKDVAQQTQLHDTVNRASQRVHQDQVLVNQAEGALSRAQPTVDTLQSQLNSDASAVSAALAAQTAAEAAVARDQAAVTAEAAAALLGEAGYTVAHTIAGALKGIQGAQPGDVAQIATQAIHDALNTLGSAQPGDAVQAAFQIVEGGLHALDSAPAGEAMKVASDSIGTLLGRVLELQPAQAGPIALAAMGDVLQALAAAHPEQMRDLAGAAIQGAMVVMAGQPLQSAAMNALTDGLHAVANANPADTVTLVLHAMQQVMQSTQPGQAVEIATHAMQTVLGVAGGAELGGAGQLLSKAVGGVLLNVLATHPAAAMDIAQSAAGGMLSTIATQLGGAGALPAVQGMLNAAAAQLLQQSGAAGQIAAALNAAPASSDTAAILNAALGALGSRDQGPAAVGILAALNGAGPSIDIAAILNASLAQPPLQREALVVLTHGANSQSQVGDQKNEYDRIADLGSVRDNYDNHIYAKLGKDAVIPEPVAKLADWLKQKLDVGPVDNRTPEQIEAGKVSQTGLDHPSSVYGELKETVYALFGKSVPKPDKPTIDQVRSDEVDKIDDKEKAKEVAASRPDADAILGIQFAQSTGVSTSNAGGKIAATAGAGVSDQQNLGGGVTLKEAAGIGASAGVQIGSTSVDAKASVGAGASVGLDFGHGVSLEVGAKAGGEALAHAGLGVQLLSIGVNAGVGQYATVQQTQEGDLGHGVTGSETVGFAEVVGATYGAQAALGLTQTGYQAGGGVGVTFKADETAGFEVGGNKFSETVGVYSPGSLAANTSGNIGYDDGKLHVNFGVGLSFGFAGFEVGGNISINLNPVINFAKDAEGKIVGAAELLASGAESVGNTVLHGIEDVGNDIKNFFTGGGHSIPPPPTLIELTQKATSIAPTMSPEAAQHAGLLILAEAGVTFPKPGDDKIISTNQGWQISSPALDDPATKQALDNAAAAILGGQPQLSAHYLGNRDPDVAQFYAGNLLKGAYDVIAKEHMTGDAAQLQIAAATYAGDQLVREASQGHATVAWHTSEIGGGPGGLLSHAMTVTDTNQPPVVTAATDPHHLSVAQLAQFHAAQTQQLVQLDQQALAAASDADKPFYQQQLAQHQMDAAKATVELHVADRTWAFPGNDRAEADQIATRELAAAGRADFPGPGFNAMTGEAANHLLEAARAIVNAGWCPPLNQPNQPLNSTDLIECAYATIRDQGLTGAAAQRQVDAAIYLGEHEFLKTNPAPAQMAQYQIAEVQQCLAHDQVRLTRADPSEQASIQRAVAHDQLELSAGQVAINHANGTWLTGLQSDAASVANAFSNFANNVANSMFGLHLAPQPQPPSPEQQRVQFLHFDGPALGNWDAWKSADQTVRHNALSALSDQALPAAPAATADLNAHIQYAKDVLQSTFATIVTQGLTGDAAQERINAALVLGKEALAGTPHATPLEITALAANQAQQLLQHDQLVLAATDPAHAAALQSTVTAELTQVIKLSSQVLLLDPQWIAPRASLEAVAASAQPNWLDALPQPKFDPNLAGPAEAKQYAHDLVELAYAKVATSNVDAHAREGLLNAAFAKAQEVMDYFDAGRPRDAADGHVMLAEQRMAHDQLAAAATDPAHRDAFVDILTKDAAGLRQAQAAMDIANLEQRGVDQRWQYTVGLDAIGDSLWKDDHIGTRVDRPQDLAAALLQLRANGAESNAATVMVADAVLNDHARPNVPNSWPAGQEKIVFIQYGHDLVDSAIVDVHRNGLTGDAAALQIEAAKVRAEASLAEHQGTAAEMAQFKVSLAQQVADRFDTLASAESDASKRAVYEGQATQAQAGLRQAQAAADIANLEQRGADQRWGSTVAVDATGDALWRDYFSHMGGTRAEKPQDLAAALQQLRVDGAESNAATVMVADAVLRGHARPNVPNSWPPGQEKIVFTQYGHDLVDSAIVDIHRNGLSGDAAALQLEAAKVRAEASLAEHHATAAEMTQFKLALAQQVADRFDTLTLAESDTAKHAVYEGQATQAHADMRRETVTLVTDAYLADARWQPAASTPAAALAAARLVLDAVDLNAPNASDSVLAACRVALHGQSTPALPAGNTDVKVAEQYAHNLVELAYATVTKYGLTGSDADMQVKAAVMVGEAEIQKLNPPPLEIAQYRVGEAYQEMQHAQQNGQLFPGDAAAQTALANSQNLLVTRLDQVFALDPQVTAAIATGDAVKIAQTKAAVTSALLKAA